ncbi:MAG: DUF1499 domain-containing protein [Oceanospirillaceae bacterium]|nr:DUF1499 domain-containing protein [Oceanospirillaceae bacterium]
MLRCIFVCMLMLALSACTASWNVPKTGRDFTLSGCPPLLNCVSSQSVVPLYSTDPFVLQVPYSAEVWENIKLQALSLSGAELGEERDGYLYVKCYSRVFKFLDHLELLLEADDQTIEVRSAAMLGILDFGVNRYRVYELHKQLQEAGLIKRND